jgi:hypothetical protein
MTLGIAQNSENARSRDALVSAVGLHMSREPVQVRLESHSHNALQSPKRRRDLKHGTWSAASPPMAQLDRLVELVGFINEGAQLLGRRLQMGTDEFDAKQF